MQTIAIQLAERLNAVLPQTQCQRCGYLGCAPYALAMAQGIAAPNRCPPGGPPGVLALSQILALNVLELDPTCGAVSPRTVATIREDLCIGCTKCIDVCPTDAIVGAPKKLHFVITEFCTGCDLCLPPCPVDCITMSAPQLTGFSWQHWSVSDAQRSKGRFERKQKRLSSETHLAETAEHTEALVQSAPQQSAITNAVERARNTAKMRLSLESDKNSQISQINSKANP
jgi:Na+-translocating ferredoxin:NAD+ oxidoreductase subunit B